jgi:hypothetical protein
MSANPFAAIERRLVDYFDHFGNGVTVEQRGSEWFLQREELEISLTELASALASDFPSPSLLVGGEE